jgi:hypothetical protein
MLELHVGFLKKIEVPKKGGCLFIADEVPELPSWRKTWCRNRIRNRPRDMCGRMARCVAFCGRLFCGRCCAIVRTSPSSAVGNSGAAESAELGEFDALVLGLFLMAHFKGQIVVPDFGFYGRDAHVSLIREGRLIAGVNSLSELPAKLRQAVLLIEDKVASGATLEDAEMLAEYARLARGTNGFNELVQDAIG